MKKTRQILRRYGIALAAFILPLIISAVLRRSSVTIDLSLLVIAAIIAASWYAGTVPGLLVAYLAPLPSNRPDQEVDHLNDFIKFCGFFVYISFFARLAGQQTQSSAFFALIDLIIDAFIMTPETADLKLTFVAAHLTIFISIQV